MSPPPCLYDTVIQSYVQLKSGLYGVGRPISWAVLHHRKSMGQIWDAPAPPGVQLLPHFEVWSYRACQPLQMWQMSHFCEIHSLSYEAWAVLHHRKSMGQLWDAPAPQGATFTPFWGMVLQSLPASSNVANFTFLWNPLSELRGVKVFRNVKSMRFFFCPYFAPGANIVPPIAYKSHSTPFPIRPHVFDTSFMALWQKLREE